ncbi:MAG: hypothetical protein IJ443_00685 [Firmicutes bacterium]|nr:hypothetical protein [Bacillota bacterium]
MSKRKIARLASLPEDYKRLGLKKDNIEPWEDGRYTHPGRQRLQNERLLLCRGILCREPGAEIVVETISAPCIWEHMYSGLDEEV